MSNGTRRDEILLTLLVAQRKRSAHLVRPFLQIGVEAFHQLRHSPGGTNLNKGTMRAGRGTYGTPEIPICVPRRVENQEFISCSINRLN